MRKLTNRILINGVRHFLINGVRHFLINGVRYFLISGVRHFLISGVRHFLISGVRHQVVNLSTLKIIEAYKLECNAGQFAGLSGELLSHHLGLNVKNVKIAHIEFEVNELSNFHFSNGVHLFHLPRIELDKNTVAR